MKNFKKYVNEEIKKLSSVKFTGLFCFFLTLLYSISHKIEVFYYGFLFDFNYIKFFYFLLHVLH